jgi:uridine kinase
VQGRDRLLVQEIGKKLGLEGTYVPRSYIEQMQLEKLTKEFQLVPEDIKQKLVSEDALVRKSAIYFLLCVIQNDSRCSEFEAGRS